MPWELIPNLSRQALVARIEWCPRPMDAIFMQAISNEASHSNAPVLDLRVPQKANRCIIRLAPELCLGQVQRIKVADQEKSIYQF